MKQATQYTVEKGSAVRSYLVINIVKKVNGLLNNILLLQEQSPEVLVLMWLSIPLSGLHNLVPQSTISFRQKGQI